MQGPCEQFTVLPFKLQQSPSDEPRTPRTRREECVRSMLNLLSNANLIVLFIGEVGLISHELNYGSAVCLMNGAALNNYLNRLPYFID